MGEWSRARSAGSSMAVLGQAGEAPVVGPAAAHHADVADIGGQGGPYGGHVELRFVGEHADGVERAEGRPDALEQAVGPVDDDLVGHRERARVANTSRASHTVTR